jgi:uncharacterized coiled-coil protein SlyX/spore maturation protein SpmB
MAQIIKHRRGSLEALSAVTSSLVKGEIVIASGSSNLTVTNGSSLVFAVPENGQVQATNRFLMGNSAPNSFAGSTYNGMVNGVPFYDSGSGTLYLLGSDTNTAINLVGNIQPFSSSVAASINALSASIGSGTIGNSVTLLNSFTASQETKDSTLATYTGSVDSKFSTLATYTGSVDSKFSTLATYTASVDSDLSALHTFTASQESKDSTLATYTASVDSRLGQLETNSGSQANRLTSLESFSGSQEAKDSTLATYTASVDGRLSNLESTSASVNGHIADINAYTQSNDTTNTAQNNRLNSLENVTGSYATTGSNVFYGTQTITGSLYITQNLVVQGSSSLENITASAVSIGTNIVILNNDTPSVRFGGIAVQDSGSGAGVSGSLLWDSLNNNWIYQHPNSGPEAGNTAILISGPRNSGSIGNEAHLTQGRIMVAHGDDHIGDSIMAETAGKITLTGNFDATGEISSSTINGIGNVTAFSQSVDSRLDSVEASLGGGGSIGTRVALLETFTGSQETKNSTLATYTGSIDSKFTTLETYTASVDSRLGQLETNSGSQASQLSNLQSFTGSQETKNSTLATYTASVDSHISNVNSYTASNDTTNTAQNNRLTSLESFSGSQESKDSTLATYTASVDSRLGQLETNSGSHASRLTSLESFSGSQETKNSTLATYTASVDSQLSQLNADSASQAGRLTNIESFTGSQNTKNSTLATYTASVDGRLSSIETFTSSFGTTFSSSVDSRLDTLEGTGTIQGVGTGNNVTFAKVTTSGDVVVGGDLVVQGNTVSLNTSTLTIEDKLITLASGSTTSATADGAGFEVEGANANFVYQHSTTAFTSSVSLIAPSVTSSINLGTSAGSTKRIAFRNTNGNLDLVPTASVAGDLLQWNGSDFVMSNTIDGGSF